MPYEVLAVDYMNSKRNGAEGMTYSTYSDLIEFIRHEMIRSVLEDKHGRVQAKGTERFGVCDLG